MKLFGTSGIRGPGEELFTNEFCNRLGFVFGTWLTQKNKQGYVAVACDPRETSPRIKRQLCVGLAAAGWEILDEGVIPTPALTLFTKLTPHVGGGIMITGSHIAANLNGTKLFINGEEVTKEHELEIEALFASTPHLQTHPEPIVTFENTGRELYIDQLKRLADLPYPKWKIVVDTANGAQTQIIRDLLPDLGLEYTCSDYCDIQSPNFVPRDTEVASHFSDLMRQVLLNQADMGIGFDADGDRVVFVDNLGRYIPGDYSCSFIAKHSQPTCIVTPVSCSSVVDQVGVPTFHTPVGSTHVAAAMKTHGCNFGFEANGGAISSEIVYGRDGASTMVKFLNTLKATGMTSSQAYDSLPQYSLFRDKTDCPFDKYSTIYQQAQNKYSHARFDLTDGVKVYFSDNEWLLFRGSGNAPEFRVFAQSADPKTADKLGHEGLSLVKSVVNPHHSTHQYHSSSAQDSLSVLPSIDEFPDQCTQVINEIAQQHIPSECYLVDNIVVSGMGGSALGGRIINSLEREALRIPVIVSTEYHLPHFVNERTLVVISSYSGNTAETISSYYEARSRGAKIYVLASGGKLADLAAKDNLPGYIFNPKHNISSQPRMGLGYNILALITLLSRCQLIHPPTNLSELPKYLKSVQSTKPKLQQLASKLQGKIPVLVSSEHLKGAAHAVKNEFNENSKTFCTTFDLPELNHHLLEGLSFPKTNPTNLFFLFITSQYYHPEIQKSYPVTQAVINKNNIPSDVFALQGPSRFFEVFELVQSGAYLAYYLSQVNGVDPGPIPWVDWYKDEIRKVV